MEAFTVAFTEDEIGVGMLVTEVVLLDLVTSGAREFFTEELDWLQAKDTLSEASGASMLTWLS